MSLNNKIIHEVDAIIIGAGIFGFYAAKILSQKGKRVIILEKSKNPFMRASAINQARVHNGYHYPRSYETAKKTAGYFHKFQEQFSFAINNSFEHIYAISTHKSKVSSGEFIHFCKEVNIPLQEVESRKYFKEGSVENAFLVEEPVFDFVKIRDSLLQEITGEVKFVYETEIQDIQAKDGNYFIDINDTSSFSAPLVINATYAGVNEILTKFHQDLFDLKYELCEVIFCSVSESFKNVGFTVMDGEYFSIIPFGDAPFHSLTSVGHTPHQVSYDSIPTFSQRPIGDSLCEMHKVRGCFVCAQNVKTAWRRMYSLSQKYLKQKFSFDYQYSKFEIKPIFKTSEYDDSRPTVIKKHSENPTLLSILSGKINTIYDLELYL